MVKRVLTADDDVLSLDPGTYYTWGVKPKNFPGLSLWSTVVVKAVGNQPTDGKNVTITDVNASQLANTYSVSSSMGRWSGWRVPNSTIMASKYDVTTAISAATANMADLTKPTNFTAGLKSGGVDVATAADLKSVADKAWYKLDNKYISVSDGTLSPWTNLLYKIDQTVKRMYLVGCVITSESTSSKVNLSNIIKSASNTDNQIGYYTGGYLYSALLGNDRTFTISTASNLFTFIGIGSGNVKSAYVTYDELV